MTPKELKTLLERIRDGKLAVEDGLSQLEHFPYRELDCAKLDTHRELRTGHPEVLFCPGKTIEQIKSIFRKM
ncbi:MAG TPA: 1-(5-phosphoribosyl)-5-amino-4-imidazole-carboxylate carboxylase, partial [Smithellaceae bacterium]|nr:1-(5-phosphoribosyl)-5-amino-4-imidazole-carboxylate carboxylase [Smithellaceae bacterium]